MKAIRLLIILVLIPALASAAVFGNNDAPEDNAASMINYRWGGFFTPSSSGNADYIYVYTGKSSTNATQLQGALYTADTVLIEMTDAISLTAADTTWRQLTVRNSPAIQAGQTYMLVVWAGGSSMDIFQDYNAPERSSHRSGWVEYVEDGFPDTASFSLHATNYALSLYCDYSEGQSENQSLTLLYSQPYYLYIQNDWDFVEELDSLVMVYGTDPDIANHTDSVIITDIDGITNPDSFFVDNLSQQTGYYFWSLAGFKYNTNWDTSTVLNITTPEGYFESTGDPADSVYLAQDSIPYTIPASGKVYVIEMDLTATGTAIDVGDVDHIEILLNDTITYGTGEADNSVGINIGSGSYWVKVINTDGEGALVHGAPESTDADTCQAIRMWGGGQYLFENIDAVVKGRDAANFDSHSAYGGNGSYMVEVKDCDIWNLCHSYEYRTHNSCSGIRLRGTPRIYRTLYPNEYHLKVTGTTVHQTPHTGISIVDYTRLYMWDDSLVIDARNDLYEYPAPSAFKNSGDAAGLSVFRGESGCIIHDNIVTTGTTYEGGNGYILQFIGGTEAEPFQFYNNVFIGANGPNEISQDGKTWGHYIRRSAGDTGEGNWWFDFHDNIFKVYYDGDSTTGNVGASAQNRLLCDYDFHDNKFYNNRYFALRADSLDPKNDVTTTAWAFMIGHVDTSRTDQDALDLWPGTGNEFWGNYYYADSSAIPLALGSEALHELSAGDIILVNDTVYNEYAGDYTIAFPQNVTYRYAASGNRLQNLTTLGEASEDKIDWTWMNMDGGEHDWCRGKTVAFEKIVDVYVTDSNSAPVENAEVRIVNAYGDTVAFGSTGIDGIYTDTVRHSWYHYDPSYDDPDTGICIKQDSTAYSDVFFEAKHQGDSTAQYVTVANGTPDQVNLPLNGAQQQSPKRKILKKLKSLAEAYHEIKNTLSDYLLALGRQSDGAGVELADRSCRGLSPAVRR